MAYFDDLIHVKLEKDSVLSQSCLRQDRLDDIHNFLKKVQDLYNMPHPPIRVISPKVCHGPKLCAPSSHGGSICPLHCRLPRI